MVLPTDIFFLEDGSIQEEYTPEEIHAFSEKKNADGMGLRAVCADQLFAIKPEAAAIPRTENGLKIQNLICKRKGKRVLEIPQLSVPQGAIAVIGENGAGKSTLMLCLSGLLSYRGELCLGERNIPYKQLPKEAYLVMRKRGTSFFRYSAGRTDAEQYKIDREGSNGDIGGPRP